MTTLKASQQGLQQIKQARSEKGWAVSDFRWIESASEILGTSWEKHGFFAEGISEGTWKRFLAGKSRINAEAFKAYCQVLGLNWEEVVATKPSGFGMSRRVNVVIFAQDMLAWFLPLLLV